MSGWICFCEFGRPPATYPLFQTWECPWCAQLFFTNTDGVDGCLWDPTTRREYQRQLRGAISLFAAATGGLVPVHLVELQA